MSESSIEHLDVLIAGAGLAGVGAACHLKRNCPDKSFAILESRDAIGGTWDLFRYPGIRSDSDMFTLGYSFKPWEAAEVIADGPAILSYVNEAARENHVDEKIRFHHRVVSAEWSSQEARWTVQIERTDTGERSALTCSFLHACCGYYRYDEGFTPEFKGIENFAGTVVHPQHWPEDLDYTGKRIVIVGSGATAVTLVPAMAEKAAHVTMVQRSPSYVVSLPTRDPIADVLRRWLPAKIAYPIVRWKNVLLGQLFFQLSRHAPKVAKALLRKGAERHLPDGYAIDTHFNPSYNPWDQRLCIVPDGNLFQAISEGKASIATDHIDTFTTTGLKLRSGDEIEADIIVTATGLNLHLLGGISLNVDGVSVDATETVSYKGMMLSGIPNLTFMIGYTNASWTLKCDLVSEYVCRLLNYMDEHGYDQVTPRRPDPSVETGPLIDLASGYVLRSIEAMPKQGAKAPWRLHQNYPRDVLMLRRGRLDDEGVEFSSRVVDHTQ